MLVYFNKVKLDRTSFVPNQTFGLSSSDTNWTRDQR